MEPIDIPAIERRARRLRAEEVRRIEGLFAERLRMTGRLLAASACAGLLAVAGFLRPLFAWNPQQQPQKTAGTRSVVGEGALFGWNPEVRHHL